MNKNLITPVDALKRLVLWQRKGHVQKTAEAMGSEYFSEYIGKGALSLNNRLISEAEEAIATSAATATPTTDPNAPALTLPINLRITYKDIASLLCSAFEGGSNYWYSIVEQQAPKTFTFKSWEPIGEKVAFEDIQVFPHIDYPLNEGGYLMIKDNEDTDGHPEAFKLSLPEIERGLATLALKHPNAMAAILSDNADAGTGDVFLQCCLFGEVIYG